MCVLCKISFDIKFLNFLPGNRILKNYGQLLLHLNRVVSSERYGFYIIIFYNIRDPLFRLQRRPVKWVWRQIQMHSLFVHSATHFVLNQYQRLSHSVKYLPSRSSRGMRHPVTQEALWCYLRTEYINFMRDQTVGSSQHSDFGVLPY